MSATSGSDSKQQETDADTPEGWSSQEKYNQRLHDILSSGGARLGMLQSECNEARQRFRTGTSLTQLGIDYGYSDGTLRNHLKGQCTHECETAVVDTKRSRVVCWVDGCQHTSPSFDHAAAHYRNDHANTHTKSAPEK